MSAPTLTTRTIGETESALGQLLRKVLGDSGLDDVEWIALRLVSSMPSVPAEGVSAELSRSRKVDVETAFSVISRREVRWRGAATSFRSPTKAPGGFSN